MTNLEKMIELSGHKGATKKDVAEWAYMNRVWLMDLENDTKFESMKQSVDHFIDHNGYSGDEHINWDKFLDAEYLEVGEYSE